MKYSADHMQPKLDALAKPLEVSFREGEIFREEISVDIWKVFL